MGKLFTSLLLMLNVFNLNAQKYDYIWKNSPEINLSGNPYGKSPILKIDFNAFTPLITVDSTLYPTMFGALSCMSDSSGSFLYYCNGTKIIDSNNNILLNGDSINFGSYSTLEPNIKSGYPVIDGIISLPNPGNQNLYDILHIKIDSYPEPYMNPHQLLHTRVDMSLNAGLGAVVYKNKQLIEDSLTRGQLQAVKHANGIDWWILVSEQNTNGYYSFLLKADTLEGPFYQQIGRNIYSWPGFGQACFSPDGTKYARVEDDLDIYDFDRCSGELCNHKYLEINGWYDINNFGFGGCAFSPNSRFVYISQGFELYQLDLWSNSLDSGLLLIDNRDPGIDLGHHLLRLAPNGKIYTSGGEFRISTIHQPDNYGLSCDFQYEDLLLQTFLTSSFPPNFPHYRMPAQDSCPPCGTFSGVEEVDEEIIALGEDFILFPNPASQTLNLVYNGSSDKSHQISISNSLGQFIYKKEAVNTNIQIDVNQWNNGIYFLTVSEDGKLVGTKSFVISH
jgi:hypothetical protein